MLKEAIYHRPKDNYAYAYDKETLHIRIRTKKDDVNQIELIFADPYNYGENGWIFCQTPMAKTGADRMFDYWLVEVKPIARRLSYGFKLQDAKDTLYLSERGFTEVLRIQSNDYFRFPFLNEIDLLQPPEWAKHTVWYQIFPDRFANGNPSNDPENVEAWEAPPTQTGLKGGDLEGIIQHIDHLVELGVNGIYLNPIFKSPTSHKYDPIDYYQIDPQFGNKETFKRLVQACHANGIKVMLDAVFNHTSSLFPPFQDVLEKGEKSNYAHWFHIHSFPVEFEPTLNYHAFGYVQEMPKLNTENPEVREYLLGIAKYWIEEFDIDGWRLDVAGEVDHYFWREFRKVVKSVKPDAYIVGEIWHDSMPWLRGDQFDSVMNYRFTNIVIDYIASGEKKATATAQDWVSLLNAYPQNVNDVIFNLLDSHDTPRMYSLCGEDKNKFKLAFLMLLTTNGSPSIYYGDEIGLTSNLHNDYTFRKSMIWDMVGQDQELFAFMKKMIHLRKTVRPLQGDCIVSIVEANDETNHLIYKRTLGNESVYVIINNGEAELNASIPETISAASATNLWKGNTLQIGSKGIKATMQSYGYLLVHVK